MKLIICFLVLNCSMLFSQIEVFYNDTAFRTANIKRIDVYSGMAYNDYKLWALPLDTNAIEASFFYNLKGQLIKKIYPEVEWPKSDRQIFDYNYTDNYQIVTVKRSFYKDWILYSLSVTNRRAKRSREVSYGSPPDLCVSRLIYRSYDGSGCIVNEYELTGFYSNV